MNTGVVWNSFIFSFCVWNRAKAPGKNPRVTVPTAKKCHQKPQTSKACPCCAYQSTVLLIGWSRLAPKTPVARAGMTNGLCDSSSFGSAEKNCHTSPSVQWAQKWRDQHVNSKSYSHVRQVLNCSFPKTPQFGWGYSCMSHLQRDCVGLKALGKYRKCIQMEKPGHMEVKCLLITKARHFLWHWSQIMIYSQIFSAPLSIQNSASL